MLRLLSFSCALLGFLLNPVLAEIEYNTINADGSFQFRHANDDIGGYYHSASGTPDNVVRGRYGSRSPASGQIEETVYSAGPRGFRVNGPKIHRKMDLAQYPVRPRGSPDDPLADPYDDPSYSFKFRTPDQSRSEENDANNRIRGLYSYVDDVGERHSVRYAAGAGTGFEVSNAVPDNPAIVGYSSPLYKAHPKTRGKMSVQRGPGGTYKLIAAGPDHRRAESRAPDGLVRGTYSFLDDKGVQRTVEYIAGAGIGYRVVHNRVGPGTHINPSVADFRLSDKDFRLANDFGRGAGGGLGSGGGGSGAGGGGGGGVGGGSGSGAAGSGPSGAGGGGRTGGKDYLRPAGGGQDEDAAGAAEDVGGEDNDGNEAGNEDDFELNSSAGGSAKADRRGYAAGGGQRGSTRYGGGNAGGGGSGGSRVGGSGAGGSRVGGSGAAGNRGGGSGAGGGSRVGGSGAGSRGGAAAGNRNRAGSSGGLNASGSRNRNRFSGDAGGSSSSESGYLPPTGSGSGSSSSGSGPGDNYNLNDDDVGSSLPPLVTTNHRILEIDRDREWVQRHRDSTIIRNVGKWYVGLPPGQSVRAHVQNIDLVPLGGRVNLSPSEALRQDEIAELSASREH
ncbi:hypothetical protein KR044_002788 [Drosophila immigrans]|nr:hypothetical protein KR044_002788 [Drosophila immigrans]